MKRPERKIFIRRKIATDEIAFFDEGDQEIVRSFYHRGRLLVAIAGRTLRCQMEKTKLGFLKSRPAHGVAIDEESGSAYRIVLESPNLTIRSEETGEFANFTIFANPFGPESDREVVFAKDSRRNYLSVKQPRVRDTLRLLAGKPLPYAEGVYTEDVRVLFLGLIVMEVFVQPLAPKD